MKAAPILIGLALREDDAAPLALGTALARLTGAPIALVAAYLPDATPSHDEASPLRDVLDALEDRADELGSAHEVAVFPRRGSPARVLHDMAEELQAAVLVVGSSHRERVGRVLEGSVAADVLHGATSAVAVAPRGYEGTRELRRIAVAYDGSPESREALAAALTLAFLGAGEIHSYTVLEPIRWRSQLTGAGASVPVFYQAQRRAHAEECAAEVRELAPEGMSVNSEVLAGEAADELARTSRDFDLLVCGSRGYGPVRSVVLGGVSRRLVSTAACPVLVLPRPPAHPRWFGHQGRASRSRSIGR
jgi:nucleotide-binding universal stress UspA family protein